MGFDFDNSVFLALFTAGAGAVWGGVMGYFSIKNKVEIHELKLNSHNQKMEELEAHMDNSHRDLKRTAVRTEQKLDRLIERFIPQHHTKGD